MIVRIMPLAPEIPNPEKLKKIKAAASLRRVSAMEANCIAGFSSKTSTSKRVASPSSSSEFHFLERLDKHTAAAPARKRSRPHSDVGVPVRISSSSQSQPNSSQIQNQQQHRHSLKLEHGSSVLGDGGFNIRLGQSSRWTLGPSDCSISKPKSGAASVGGKPRDYNSWQDEDEEDIGIRPLPSSPKRPKHWAPALRQRAHQRGGGDRRREKQQRERDVLYFGFKGAIKGPRTSASSSSSGSSPSTSSAPAWLDSVGVNGNTQESLSLSDSENEEQRGSPSPLISLCDVEYDASLSASSEGDSDEEEDQHNEEGDAPLNVSVLSVDSGIDSAETLKLRAGVGVAAAASASVGGRAGAAGLKTVRLGGLGTSAGSVRINRAPSHSQREIYGLATLSAASAAGAAQREGEIAGVSGIGMCMSEREVFDVAAEPDLFSESFYLYQRKRMAARAQKQGVDHFSTLPDEMIMKVLAWLPKPALGRMAQVSKRFNRVASDESLWTHVDCQGKNLSWDEVHLIMQHKPVFWRLARASIHAGGAGERECADTTTTTLSPLPFSPQLAYLDLSMIIATPAMLKALLAACPNLRKLSLEHQEVTPEMLNTATATFAASLDTLNLTICNMVGGGGADALCNLLAASPNLKALNIGCVKQEWSQEEIMRVMSSMPEGLEQLNMAGFRQQINDTHVQIMASRCPGLVELDLSDAQSIRMMSIEAISHLAHVQHLGLSRCYSVEAESYELLSNMKALRFLDIFSIYKDELVDLLTALLPGVRLNQYPFSSVARPTVGAKRSSIWEEKVRD